MSNEPKLKRIHYMIDDRGRSVISRAVMLRHALSNHIGTSDPDHDGVALVEIASEWLQANVARLAEKGPG